MRFDSARAAGLDEARAQLVNDGYAAVLAEDETAALALTDALIGVPQPLTAEMRGDLEAQFTEAQIVEITLGVGLFLGMSKVLISLGLEPQDMPTTVIPTPGS